MNRLLFFWTLGFCGLFLKLGAPAKVFFMSVELVEVRGQRAIVQ